MDQDVHNGRSSDSTAHQLGRQDRDSGLTWDHVITAVLLIWFFLGIAVIFADLWIPIIPYLKYSAEVVGDPVLFMLSLVMFLSILWNISFYINRRKELLVARKLIRWVASQKSVMPRTDKERIDQVLKTAIWALRCGESVRDIIDGLQEGTRDGEALPEGWARSHFNLAVTRLEEATRRDWVFDAEQRIIDLAEGEKALWMARAEALKVGSNLSTVM